jgi:hypothetical protein
MPNAPFRKPTPAETRRARMAESFAKEAINLAEMLERDYGLQMDDQRHKALVADIQRIIVPKPVYSIPELLSYHA